jgi:hypothetical protein
MSASKIQMIGWTLALISAGLFYVAAQMNAGPLTVLIILLAGTLMFGGLVAVCIVSLYRLLNIRDIWLRADRISRALSKDRRGD